MAPQRGDEIRYRVMPTADTSAGIRIAWRQDAPYAALAAADRSALAWEILRRDPNYRGRNVGRPPGGSAKITIRAVDPYAADKWGLLFRRSPRVRVK